MCEIDGRESRRHGDGAFVEAADEGEGDDGGEFPERGEGEGRQVACSAGSVIDPLLEFEGLGVRSRVYVSLGQGKVFDQVYVQ
ncbi:hypothetical protein DFQ29_004734 [Apophysomyces sp. BC1021]|nr:hypothetical protein DFQ29_004734 [Apophysomyces sp. BC1021]